MPKFDVVQTQQGKPPEVDVEISDAQVPKYDVDVTVPDVDVQTKTVQADVPDVDVEKNQVDIEVPTGIEIKMHGEDGNERVDE